MASNMSRPTKAERRAAARARAMALRAEQERRARRATIARRSLLAGGATILLGGIGAGIVLASKDEARNLPNHVRTDGSWTVGAGGVGTVNDGAPDLEVYFDYACHFCANLEVGHSKEISALVADGRVTLVLRPAKILSQQWTDWNMTAVGLALDKEPDKALTLHNALLAALSTMYQAQDTTNYTLKGVIDIAKQAGMSTSVTSSIEGALKKNAYRNWSDVGTATFSNKGFNSTPRLLLAGKEYTLSADFYSNSKAITTMVEDLGSATGSASPETVQQDG